MQLRRVFLGNLLEIYCARRVPANLGRLCVNDGFNRGERKKLRKGQESRTNGRGGSSHAAPHSWRIRDLLQTNVRETHGTKHTKKGPVPSQIEHAHKQIDGMAMKSCDGCVARSVAYVRKQKDAILLWYIRCCKRV